MYCKLFQCPNWILSKQVLELLCETKGRLDQAIILQSYINIQTAGVGGWGVVWGSWMHEPVNSKGEGSGILAS